MSRIQLFEFNERSECPAFIREALTETLGQGLKLGGIYKNVAPLFSEFCQTAEADSVLDLCSGSGEPVSIFLSALQAQQRSQNSPQHATLPKFTLSDLLPNRKAMGLVASRHPGLITPVYTAVDATNVPQDMRFPACTIISSFHHFTPKMAYKILQNCVAQDRAVFIVEPFTRNLKRATAPVPALATAAYWHPIKTKEKSLLKGFFTYAIPLIPIIGAWDATISFCRIYSKKMLLDMVAPFRKVFHWRYEEVPYWPFGNALVFYGVPIAPRKVAQNH